MKKVLGYNFAKITAGNATVILTSSMSVDQNGETNLERALTDMEIRIPSGIRTKKTVFHCSVNPHPNDRLTTEQLQDIAREYMEKMGYGKQPYIVFKHNDIAREHIHIVSLRVDSYGKKLPYKFEARRSKKITDELERKYGLIPSGSRRKKEITMAEPKPVEPDSGDIRAQIASAVRGVLKRYAFRSVGEMNVILQRYNLRAEEVKTQYRGKQYDGIVYMATDNEGNKTSMPIKSSEIGHGVGYAAIRHHMEKSKPVIKEKAELLRHAIIKVMQTSPNKEEFVTRMNEQGVKVVCRMNEQGRLYGITFLSEEWGIVVNGSRLGKGYAANVFNDYFLGGENPFSGYKKQENRELPAVFPVSESLQEGEADDDFYDEPDESDELGLVVHGIDYKELAFQRKLRRKKQNKLRKKK